LKELLNLKWKQEWTFLKKEKTEKVIEFISWD